MVPEIIIVQGEGLGQRRSLEGVATLRIGRAPVNDLVVDGRGVSRFHCVLRHSENAWSVLDMGGANGTLVNGQRIHEHRLQPGDLIEIGDTILRFGVGRARSGGPPKRPPEAKKPRPADAALEEHSTVVLTPLKLASHPSSPTPSPAPSQDLNANPPSPTLQRVPDLATPHLPVPTPTVSPDIPVAIPVAEPVVTSATGGEAAHRAEPTRTTPPHTHRGLAERGPQVPFDGLPFVLWPMVLAGGISIGLFLVFALRVVPWESGLGIKRAWLVFLWPLAALAGLPFWLVAVAASDLAALDAAGGSLKNIPIPTPRLNCPRVFVGLQYALGLLILLAGAVAFFAVARHSIAISVLLTPLYVLAALDVLFPAELVLAVRRLVAPALSPSQTLFSWVHAHVASSLWAVGTGLRYGGMAFVWLVFVIAFLVMARGSAPLSEVLAAVAKISLAVLPVALGVPFLDRRGIKAGDYIGEEFLTPLKIAGAVALVPLCFLVYVGAWLNPEATSKFVATVLILLVGGWLRLIGGAEFQLFGLVLRSLQRVTCLADGREAGPPMGQAERLQELSSWPLKVAAILALFFAFDVIRAAWTGHWLAALVTASMAAAVVLRLAAHSYLAEFLAGLEAHADAVQTPPR